MLCCYALGSTSWVFKDTETSRWGKFYQSKVFFPIIFSHQTCLRSWMCIVFGLITPTQPGGGAVLRDCNVFVPFWRWLQADGWTCYFLELLSFFFLLIIHHARLWIRTTGDENLETSALSFRKNVLDGGTCTPKFATVMFYDPEAAAISKLYVSSIFAVQHAWVQSWFEVKVT